MKTLYLVRHGKSSWKQPQLADIDRPLNKRGKNDAPFIGELLAEKRIKPDLVISSPAKRAMKTALAVTDKIGYPSKKIIINENVYESSGRELVEVLKSIDDKYNSVMLFGHNPGFTMLHNYLSNHYIENIPTCGVVALQFDKTWKEIGKNSAKLLFFEHPKLYPDH